MRISDWSSDVCSSDLRQRGAEDRRGHREADQRVPAPHLPLLAARRPRLYAGASGYEEAARARRSARLQRRHVPGLERDCGEEPRRSEEHTSELQSLMRISYAVLCLKKKKSTTNIIKYHLSIYTT